MFLKGLHHHHALHNFVIALQSYQYESNNLKCSIVKTLPDFPIICLATRKQILLDMVALKSGSGKYHAKSADTCQEHCKYLAV